MSLALSLLLPFLLLALSTAQGCFLTVPSNPLTAVGLSTPYLLSGVGCNQTLTGGSVFVEATILTPSTGALHVYSPLVVNSADPTPAVPPTLPTLPADAVVALFFGANTDSVTLQGPGATLCTNGLPGSVFGQVAFCNAQQFFTAANASIRAGLLVVPGLGMGTGRVRCPTTRAYSVVDQDPSDNVLTSYLIVAHAGHTRMAQNTVGNRALYPQAVVEDNGSDNALLGEFILPALGCPTWRVVDLADTSNKTVRGSQALNELQANAWATTPVALIPAGDEMVQVDGGSSLAKVNAYRVNVDQPLAVTLAGASTTDFCFYLLTVGLPTILLERDLTSPYATPDAGAATNLFTFLGQRWAASYELLQCPTLLGIQQPVTVVTDHNGVATGVQLFGWHWVLD